MPVFREAGLEAKQRLLPTSKGKGYQQRQVYREKLAKLIEGKLWELTPEDDETLRKLKVNVRRAANELNMNVGYGDTAQGTLLVWTEPRKERAGRRGRPRKPTEASQVVP